MKTKDLKIKCTNCGTTINLDSALISQFEKDIRADLKSELANREITIQKHKEEVEKLSSQLESEKKEFDSLVNRTVKNRLETQEAKLKDSIRMEIENEKSKQLQELEDELVQKSSQLIELNQTKAKMKRLSREFEEREAKIHLQMEEKLNQRLKEMKDSVTNEIELQTKMKLSEKENIIDSLQKKLQDAQNRISQGSMQSQGESMELVLEDLLSEIHPNDSIIEIKKGVNGADCIQEVKTSSGKLAGRIVYESKNTKTWSNKFIEKVKEDTLKAKGDISVIVTRTLPKDIEGDYGLIDGVYITTLNNVKNLSLLLRYGVLKTYSILVTQSGKEDKKTLLYDYLTSEECKATFEGILDGLTALQESHDAEQKKLQVLWKKRSQYLLKMQNAIINHYGSIKGISGEVISDISVLEFKDAA